MLIRTLSCCSTNQKVSLLIFRDCRSFILVYPFVCLFFFFAGPDSNGGAFLTRQGDFNVGSIINTFVRIRCKSSAGLAASTEIKIALMDKRHSLFYGTYNHVRWCGLFSF